MSSDFRIKICGSTLVYRPKRYEPLALYMNTWTMGSHHIAFTVLERAGLGATTAVRSFLLDDVHRCAVGPCELGHYNRAHLVVARLVPDTVTNRFLYFRAYLMKNTVGESITSATEGPEKPIACSTPTRARALCIKGGRIEFAALGRSD
jgi:hypothetical protein